MKINGIHFNIYFSIIKVPISMKYCYPPIVLSPYDWMSRKHWGTLKYLRKVSFMLLLIINFCSSLVGGRHEKNSGSRLRGRGQPHILQEQHLDASRRCQENLRRSPCKGQGRGNSLNEFIPVCGCISIWWDLVFNWCFFVFWKNPRRSWKVRVVRESRILCPTSRRSICNFIARKSLLTFIS